MSDLARKKLNDTEYEIRDAINVNELTVFLSFTEEHGTVLCSHMAPISYGSLTEGKRKFVDNCVSIINSLSPRGDWYFEELEKEHPDEEDLEFLMYKATWPNTCPPERVGSEIFNTLIILSELHGFIGMFMFSAEDIPATNNKQEKRNDAT